MSKAFRVGIFVVFGLLSLSAGIFLIGNKEFLFDQTYRLRTDFQNISGLENGSDVRVGGIHEGTISRIDLPTEPGGKITVEMTLHDSTRQIIRKDSVASIKTEGLLGNKYLEISFGTGKAEALKNGDVIASEVPVDFGEQAKSLVAEAKTGVEAFSDNMEALQHNFLLNGGITTRVNWQRTRFPGHPPGLAPMNSSSMPQKSSASRTMRKSSTKRSSTRRESFCRRTNSDLPW